MGVFPHNDRQLVNNFLEDYGMSPNAIIQLEDTQARKNVLPETLSAVQLFSEVLDIFGKPGRRFYETLAMAASDEAEKKEIEFLLTKEGKEDLRKISQVEMATYADLMKKWPSTKLNLEYLLDYVPRIKPRLYSIASSADMHPDELHLCIVKEDWESPTGEVRYGLATRYLSDKGLDSTPDLIAANMNAAGINVPDTHAAPCVMVGLGTGIAPFRAMIEEREVNRTAGESVGPMSLFFGARHKRTDYTYGDELEEYHSNGKGVLTDLSLAFSRDQEHKIYVQNRMAEHPEMLYDYLHKKKGYFYLCGPAGNVPPAVKQAVVDSFVSVGGHKPEEAEQMVTDMQIEGRYNVEAW